VIRRLTLPFCFSLAAVAPGLCAAQAGGAPGAGAAPVTAQTPVPDSIAVVGSKRNSVISIIQISGLIPGRAINYRDVQRAIQALYTSGQFDEVAVTQTQLAAGKNVLVIHVHERPLLVQTVTDLKRLPECQIVYVAESSNSGVRAVLAQVGSASILTVGETSDFAQNGGILALRMRDTLVQFEVNIVAARRAGITISSKILRLGAVVGGTAEASENRR